MMLTTNEKSEYSLKILFEDWRKWIFAYNKIRGNRRGQPHAYKYTKLYSGAEPEFIEGDVFEIIIPLTTGAMTKVGPGTSLVSGGEVSGEVGGEVSGEVGTVTVKLDASKLSALLDFCSEARSRVEMQEFCGIKSQDYFRKNILLPLLDSGRLNRMAPTNQQARKTMMRW